MGKLAISGGSPVRKHKFETRQTISSEEKKAVMDVMDQGDISLFFGSPGPFFLGGPKVKAFEQAWASAYGYKHAITVNSWTTGLVTCIGSLGLGPGDEVICTPYSMSATSTSILFYGAIPVFVDIEEQTYCIDPKKIEAAITPRTKAIMLVHLFGHPADMDAILAIAKKHNLKVIEDAAHAPGVKYKGKYVGALQDVGGFSLNYHKHIHTGEGGMIVTNNDDIALKCQMIRNHGENVIEQLAPKDLANSIGSNYRLTELQAALGTIQLGRLPKYLVHRNSLHLHLQKRLAGIECLKGPIIKTGCEHAFYGYAYRYQQSVLGISRQLFVDAVNAEIPKPDIWEQQGFTAGYVKPLYLNPVYQKKIALGSKGFPFNYNSGVDYNYSRGICPVVERMHFDELLITPLVREAVSFSDIDDFANAIIKVVENVAELRDNL